jgi:hypothetical protein
MINCKLCNDTGWKPNVDDAGDRIWLPLLNDALPCTCGALTRKQVDPKETVV